MRQALALDHLGQMIQAQADTLAFQDGFRMAALVFIVALIPAWVLAVRGHDRPLPDQ
jgi:hypothetical protein